MLRQLGILALLSVIFAHSSIGLMAWTHGSLAQAVLTTLQITAVNPTVGDASDRRAVDISCTVSPPLNNNPNFSDQNCMQLTQTVQYGQNVFGGGTNAKTTFIPLLMTGNMAGAGQRFLLGRVQNCYGMGDCFMDTSNVTFGGAGINGDEGQGFQAFSYLQQQQSLTKYTISSVPAQTTCSTTLAQSVTASLSSQTISVVSSANCNINDWVIIDQALPTNSPNLEEVQITGVGAGQITGIFRNNHSSGATITPALVLNLSGSAGLGQHRVLVDLTSAQYITGTVSSITGGGFTGSGTTWTTGMVGGSATNIGCVTLAADDYTSAPFSLGAGALKSWYQIGSLGSTTSIGIYTTSTAGNAAYHGFGPGSGSYAIAQCARVMRTIGNQVIAETSSSTWTAADTIEQIIAPYPDVSGYLWYIQTYTPGGAYRSFFDIRNQGSRMWFGSLVVTNHMQTGSNADASAFQYGVYLGDNATQTGIYVGNTSNQAVAVGCPQHSGAFTSDQAGRVTWGAGGGGPYIQCNTANLGMDIATLTSGGALLSSKASSVIGTGSSASLSYDGIIGSTERAFSTLPTCAAGTAGLHAAISDSTTTTYGATIAGGGSNHVPAYCNGTNWTVH